MKGKRFTADSREFMKVSIFHHSDFFEYKSYSKALDRIIRDRTWFVRHISTTGSTDSIQTPDANRT